MLFIAFSEKKIVDFLEEYWHFIPPPPIYTQTEDLDFRDNAANTWKIDVYKEFDISPARVTIGGGIKSQYSSRKSTIAKKNAL